MQGAYIQELQASYFSKEAADEADGLWHLDSPWFEGHALHASLWYKQVFGAMQLKTLGRMLFPVILQHIHMQFMSDPVSAAHTLAPLTGHLETWATEDVWEQVERQLLLKELCIGCRAKDLPIWTGHIIMRDTTHQRHLSLVPVRLRHGSGVIGVYKDSVAYVRAANVDLSEHKHLLEVPEDMRRCKDHVLVIKVSSS